MNFNGITEMVCIVRDISDRKILEEERLKMAKLETIQNMIVTINHQMNQSLSVILSQSSLLEKEAEKGSQLREDVSMIREEATRLSELIRKISILKELKLTDYTSGTKMIDI